MPSINIYCDESCHLPNDGKPLMVLGAISCPVEKTREVAIRLREIKVKHGLASTFEVIWGKVSRAKEQLYLDLVDYFFDDDDLKFRGVVAHKVGLDHAKYDQTHDDWYYKMMYQLLSRILTPDASYRIYLDMKDTRSGAKVDRLHKILSNGLLDFDHRIVERVQIVESHAVEQMQLSDLLLGAISYLNRDLAGNTAKEALVERIRRRSGYQLTRSTLLRAEKFNLFHWNQPALRASVR